MLQTHPTHSISERGTDPYGIILFLEIDCDEGPLDLTLIGSLEQFNRLYQSERKTPSFLMAIWLLQMGYTLQIARVNGCDNRTSLLLTSNGEYSSPKYGKIYEPLDNQSEVKASILTYGATIEISKTKNFSSIVVPIDTTIYSDYILYQTRLNINGLSSWGVIAFDSKFLVNSAELGYGIYSNLVESSYFVPEECGFGDSWNPNNPTIRKKIVKTIITLLQKHAGVFVDDRILYLDKNGFEHEDDDDEVVTYGISYYSTIKKIPMNSSFTVKENPFINFDIKCRYLINDRVLELYSKYDSSIKNIKVSIIGIGSSIIDGNQVKVYLMTIQKFDVDGNVLALEQYNLNTGMTLEEADQLLNINSQIVEGHFYSETGYLPELPISEEDGYWLDRCPEMKDATIDNFVKKLEDTDYVDSMVYLDPFMGTNETAYLKRLEELCTAQNLVFTNYKDKYDYNKLSECIFYGTFEYNGYNYPTYMLLLYLLSQTSTLEGVLDLKIEYDKPESEDGGLTINYIFKDNYRTEVLNPLAYYNYSDISLYGVFTIIMVVNGVIWSIKNNPVCTEKDIDRWYNETLRNVENKLSSDVVVSLEERKIDNRTCTLKFGVEVTFYYSKYFTLNFNIRL